MAVTVEPLTTGLVKLAPIAWSKLDVNAIRYNQVGAFTLQAPATPRIWDLVTFDADKHFKPVAFFLDWNGVFGVPLLAESYNPVKQVDDAGTVTESITFAGGDFFALLANRLVYRNAALTWAAQTPGTTTVAGKAETVIKQLVAANCVTAADTTRRIPHFTVAPDQARGGDVTYTIFIKDPASTATDKTATIDQSVMDMIRSVARQSNIGVRIDLVNGQLVFDCYLPRDLSGKAVFSTELGNLRGWNLTDAVPTSNAILMQSGTTTGAFSEAAGAGATDPWRRVETYSDQSSTTDAAQIAQAKLDELARGAAATKLALTGIDIPRLRFGSDAPGVQGYGPGDIVATDLRSEVTYTDAISAVQLVADATGPAYTETVTPTIGAADSDPGDDATATAQLAARVRDLENRLKAR